MHWFGTPNGRDARIMGLGVAGVAILALCACSTTQSLAAPEPSHTTQSPAPTPEASAAQSASPSALAQSPTAPTTEAASPTAPAQAQSAGHVSDRQQATVQGQGDQAVKYEIDAGIAAVVKLDCAGCSSPVQVTAPGRLSNFGTVKPSNFSEFLMSPLKSADQHQEVWVKTDGPWKMTISSWNTVPRKNGAVKGTGSRVFWSAGTNDQARMQWKPGHAGDKLQTRYFRADSDDSLMFGGDDDPYDEVLNIKTPGVVSVQTDGEWTFTPQ